MSDFVPLSRLTQQFEPNRDGSPWYARVFRITNWRILSQAFFLCLFLFLSWVTWFSRLEGYPVSVFLEVDPLVATATAISTHTVYRWLWRGLLNLLSRLLQAASLSSLPS